MKITYIDKNFRQSTLSVIDTANAIIEEYQAEGFTLTLRQLYYQMVSRDYIENSQRSYSRLGSIIADARMAGLIDWEAIEDRTRNLRGNSHWKNPAQIVQAAVNSYRIDKWFTQEFRPEVWIEKDALVGVISGVCSELDIDYFSCRGYASASEVWKAGRRFMSRGQTPVIIHLGDHDPSGIDMTRDIAERLAIFSEMAVTVNRIALNMDQVDEYSPPPNPAKLTDSRAEGYIKIHGLSSWELDALEPRVLASLIRETVLSYRNDDLWGDAVARENEGAEALRKAAEALKESLQ